MTDDRRLRACDRLLTLTERRLDALRQAAASLNEQRQPLAGQLASVEAELQHLAVVQPRAAAALERRSLWYARLSAARVELLQAVTALDGRLAANAQALTEQAARKLAVERLRERHYRAWLRVRERRERARQPTPRGRPPG